MNTESNSLTELRKALFETLRGVKNGSITIDKARAVNELGKTLVDTAKVEVDFLRVTGGDTSSFIVPGEEKPLPPGITGTTVHRIR